MHLAVDICVVFRHTYFIYVPETKTIKMSRIRRGRGQRGCLVFFRRSFETRLAKWSNERTCMVGLSAVFPITSKKKNNFFCLRTWSGIDTFTLIVQSSRYDYDTQNISRCRRSNTMRWIRASSHFGLTNKNKIRTKERASVSQSLIQPFLQWLTIKHFIYPQYTTFLSKHTCDLIYKHPYLTQRSSFFFLSLLLNALFQLLALPISVFDS